MTKNKYWSTSTEDVKSSFMLARKDKKAASKAFYAWLADRDCAVKAEIWDEGFEAGQDEADGHEAAWQWGGPHTCITNPYREERK